MAQTFDIRFARTEGLLALFEAPANRFRWKGAGRLSIDAQGISIAVKRGLSTLIGRGSRRFAAGSLSDVYREGNAVRLEFSTENTREVFPIWANGSDAAAEIVKLLPTLHTVELEHATASVPAYRFDRTVIAGLLVCLAALMLGSWALQRNPAPPVLETREAVVEPNVEAWTPPAASPAATTPAVEKANPLEAQPLAPGSRAHAAARLHLATFDAELAERLDEYLEWLESPSPVELEALDEQWAQMVQRINGDMNYQGPELWKLRDVQLAICQDSRAFLRMFAKGLREQQSWYVGLAFSQRQRADAGVAWLRWYVP